jgi:hypothetical protein
VKFDDNLSLSRCPTPRKAVLIPFVVKFAQAMIKPYSLKIEIFVKGCDRILIVLPYDKFEQRYLTLKAMRSGHQ